MLGFLYAFDNIVNSIQQGQESQEGRKESKTLDTYLKGFDFKEKTIKRARAQLKNEIKAVKEGQRWVVELRDPVDPFES